MHLNLTDPRLIAGAVVIVLIIVIGVAFYVRNRRKTTAGFRKSFWAGVRPGCSRAWVRTQGRSEAGGS
jgi:hypothetical protein